MEKKTKRKFGSRTKANDQDIIVLNALGLSLSTIAATLKIVPTTVSSRLRANGIEPAPSRKAFMEEIITSLTAPQRQWLASKVNTQYPIDKYVLSLISDQYIREMVTVKNSDLFKDQDEDYEQT